MNRLHAAPYLVALAVILLAPAGVAHAQPEPGSPTRQTTRYSNGPERNPVVGFATGMNPGPGNSFTYPYIRLVVPGSAAETAGMMADDTIISIDGRDMRQPQPEFPGAVAGRRYLILVRRGTEEIELVYTYPRIEQTEEGSPQGTPAAAPHE